MQNDNQTDAAPQPSGSYDMPMKWHKFLINFSLWAGAVMNVGSAIMTLTGAHYGVSSDEVAMIYRFYDGLKIVDVLMGLACLAVAALLIVTRFSLAGFKANGPKLLMISYAAGAAVSLLYLLIAAAVTKLPFTDLVDSSSISSIITSVAMIFVNKAYYDKRASLFVNYNNLQNHWQ